MNRPMEAPRLLLVTPTLGTSEFLEEMMASTRGLPCRVRHVISCPRPRVADLARRFPDCDVIADAGPQGGIYGALNAALTSFADDSWDWFSYINDDDLLGVDFPGALGLHIGRAQPESVVYGNIRLIDENGAPFGWVTTEPDATRLELMLHQTMSPLNQQGMLFSRAVVERLKGFDLNYGLCADLDFWVRALAAGVPFRYCPCEMGRFRVRKGQLSSDVERTSAEFRDIVQRHFPRRPGDLSLWTARLRYRFINLPRYLERFRHRGIRTSEELLSDGH